MTINVGDPRRLQIKFYDRSLDPDNPDYVGVLADPDDVTFTYYSRNPLDRVTLVYETDDEVVRSSKGIYHVDILHDTPGYFCYDALGEGAVEGYEKGSYIVENNV